MPVPTTVTVERVADVRDRQLVWPEWAQRATEGAKLVRVTTAVTPFGNFLVGMENADAEGGA